MMLKEGWGVRNVTTIVGLRAYAAPSDILPEQTQGRGLRKMYAGGIEEYVSVVGTDAFMEFVERITAEGVVLDRKPMDAGSKGAAPLIVELDEDKDGEQLAALDFELPVLTPRVYREYAASTINLIRVASLQHRTFLESSAGRISKSGWS